MDAPSGEQRLNFRNDYSDGAHPRVLQALVAANAGCNVSYGLDRHSLRAAQLIRNACAQPDAAVHLLAGGTQTNLVALSAFLRPHQALLATEHGHVATHETGAIEATGHKVLTVPSRDGKLSAEALAPVLAAHTSEHMVQPRLVYISQSTELGTIYSRAELQALSMFCRCHGLLLFVDGARIGVALSAPGNDLSLPDLAALADAFYIGGTKNGALLGEALVIVDPALQTDARYLIKQRGAILARGLVLGAQFEALFEDGLYLELAARANAMARRLREGLAAAGAEFVVASPTNQQFILVDNAQVQVLERRCQFERWRAEPDGRTVIRFVTSWATRPEDVDALCRAYAEVA